MGDGERWKEAARRYRESTSERAVDDAAAELAVFLNSPEGAAAMALVDAKGPGPVELALEKGSSSITIWLLSSQGLQKAMLFGTGKPVYEAITPREAVLVAFERRRENPVYPGAFMAWLRRSLDDKAVAVEKALEGVVRPGTD